MTPWVSIYPWKHMLPLFSSSFFVHHFKDMYLIGILFSSVFLTHFFKYKKIFQDQDWNQAAKCFILFFLCQKKERKSCVTRGSRERERRKLHNFHMHLQCTKLLSYVGRWFSSFCCVVPSLHNGETLNDAPIKLCLVLRVGAMFGAMWFITLHNFLPPLKTCMIKL